MLADRTGNARHDATDCCFVPSGNQKAPRAAFPCRLDSARSIGFALTLLMLWGILPAVGFHTSVAQAADATARERFTQQLDHDGNGVEDLLDQWLAGTRQWSDLQAAVRPAMATDSADVMHAKAAFPGGDAPASAVVAEGRLRLLCFGATAGQLSGARKSAAKAGTCRVVHDLNRFGGVTVLDVDAQGLQTFLANEPDCSVMLDRDGVPALVNSRKLAGVGRVTSGDLDLGNDWSATVAILDSGMDSAHGDLGDAQDDDLDGPAPAVGDVDDWFDAAGGWPLFAGHRVVGWQDVSDDFPNSVGPWDYHHHGTALASVVAGSGAVNPDYRGMAPGGRLTIVKFYDFDLVWHAWAGDFLAACAWTLDNRETYRIRTVLSAVNWDVDAGISLAMAAFVDAGIMPVAAMGNYGDDPAGPGFPASLPDVLTAGAANAEGAVSAFSGRGGPVTSKPDLVAPGGGLLQSGGRIIAADNEPNDSYSGRFGTSLAAAHVAGAAFMLDEALLENGIVAAQGRTEVKARQTVLKLTTAHVPLAETASGVGTVALPSYTGHDPARGFGHLRIDAAVHAVADPLQPGLDQTDSLSIDWQKPVVSRRLSVSAGVRYLVEAVPSGSLDISLEVVEVSGLAGSGQEQVVRMDLNGAGVSEFAYVRPEPDSWSFLVVKRLSGAGSVVLRLIEAETFIEQGAAMVLPGVGTGAPNVAQLAGFSGPSLVIPSRVLVDPVARSLNVTDVSGTFRPGWPVFVFPNGSSQGGLTLPMVQNMDGVTGDEIVVASDFGSVYFFKGDGSLDTVDLAFNRSLTAPVGFRNAVGGWRVLVVDKLGWLRSWSWNAAVNAPPELDQEVFVDHVSPLPPAAGQLTNIGGESVVVAFADGWVGVFDENLALRTGWPKDLGTPLEVGPVLCDLNGDDLHEIVLPVRDEATGQLQMRVFDGAGNAMPGDGAVVPSPGGGPWLNLSEAVVSGRYGTGQLNVAVAGLAANGLGGDQAAWSLGLGRLFAGGATGVSGLQGFAVGATTDQGELQLDNLLLPAPLAWNQSGGFGTETAVLFHATWQEVLYGFTSIPGATTGWLLDAIPGDNLVQKQPLLLGGAKQSPLAFLGAMLVPLENGAHLRVEVRDRQLSLMPVLAGQGSAALWRTQRGDNRNSGAYPLKQVVSAVPVQVATITGLRAFPNPGSGRISFRAQGGILNADAQLEIFDLRGHRVRQVLGTNDAGVMHWDGRDGQGRHLAAGTYLAVVRTGTERRTTRVVLTR